MSSLRDIVDDVNPVDETPPDVLALIELFESQDLISFEYSLILDFVGDLLKGSTQIVDEVLQGSEVHMAKKGTPYFPWMDLPLLENIRQIVCEENDDIIGTFQRSKVPMKKRETCYIPCINRNFAAIACSDLPLLENIRQIVCEMKTCKNGVEPDEKAKTILNMLPKYSWTGKAVLTLAAFAVVFGDFCVFAKIHHSVDEKVLKSLAILKGVPIFANSFELLKRQVIIHQLKETIETILQVMQKIVRYLPEPLKMDEIVNLIITTVVACAIEVSNLTNDKESDESQNLFPYLKQIQEVLNTIVERKISWIKEQDESYNHIGAIKEQDEFYSHISWKKEKDGLDNHIGAIRMLQDSRTGTVEILKRNLIEDDQPELIDASASHEQVKIDVLREKNVFLFISSLHNVTKNEILALKAVYEETKKDDNYTIVWIPIVEEWTDLLRNKLDTILSFSNQMFWYVLPSFSLSVNGVKFIKSCWDRRENEPALLLLNPQGQVENDNAFHQIYWYGMEFFPFDLKAQDIIYEDIAPGGPRPEVREIISSWHVCYLQSSSDRFIKEKCIFFYGGEDDNWIQQFTEKVTAVAKNTFLKGKYIEIEYFYVGKTAKGKAFHRILGQFWAGVLPWLFFATQKKVDPVTQVIKKLLSNKNLSQWAVLCKDSSVVISGDGSRFLTVLNEFNQWKKDLDEKSFELAFKDCHETRASP